MVIHNIKPHDNYTMLDNNVLRLRDMHSGAKVLYCFLASMQNGKRISREYIAKSLGISTRTVSTQIAELEKRNLLVLDRVGAKEYDCYLGTSRTTASNTMRYWKREPVNGEITDQQLLDMQTSSSSSNG